MAMETWRLSRIQEELEQLDFTTDPEGENATQLDSSGEQTGADSDGELGLPPPPPPLSYNIYYKTDSPPPPPPPPTTTTDEGEIYSKVVIRPAYKSPTAEDKSKEAIRFISEKYDSLGKVRASFMSTPAGAPPPPPPPPTQQQDTSTVGVVGNGGSSYNSGVSAVFAAGLNTRSLPGYEGLGYPDTTEHPIKAPHLPCAYPPQQQQQQQQQQQLYGQQRALYNNNNMNNATNIGSGDVPPPGSAVNNYNLPPLRHPDSSGLPVGQGTGGPGLTDQDLVQVEMFFKGHKTDVFVCQSMANLYYGTLNGSPSKGGPNAQPEKWTFIKSGIPVLVLDSGESRRQRRLSVVLAERGTGFALWKDSMNHLSEYKSPHGTFHTMHLSSDHTKLAGFSFDDAAAAAEFIHKINTLTSDPDDHMLFLSGKGKKKKESSRFKFRSKSKYKAPSKADISTPCCFTHITKLDRTDGMSILSTPAGGSNPNNSLPSSPVRGLDIPRTSVRLSKT